MFECRHNIRNQPVSTAIPSPNLFRDITTTETQQHFGKILKDIFFDFSSRQYDTPTDKAHRQTLLALILIFTHISKFFLFIINPRILSFSQIVFSLYPLRDPNHLHLSLPQQLPTPPTSNTTILLPPSLIRIQYLHYILLTLSLKLLSNKLSCSLSA